MNHLGTVATALTTVSGSITLLNVLYVGGALIIMGGMTLFMTLGWGSSSRAMLNMDFFKPILM
jgi:hypothetical protein